MVCKIVELLAEPSVLSATASLATAEVTPQANEGWVTCPPAASEAQLLQAGSTTAGGSCGDRDFDLTPSNESNLYDNVPLVMKACAEQ